MQSAVILALAAAVLGSVAARPATGQERPETPAARRAMTPVDVINLPAMNSPQRSPDGSQTLFVRETSDWERNKRVSDLWIADGRSIERQLTTDPADEDQPAFSPDGATVSFLAERAQDEHRQIYLLPLRDGGEARRLTAHGASIRSYAWAPDGKTIFFLADAPLPGDLAKRRKAKDDMVPFGEDLVRRHVWRVDVATGAIARVTPEDRRVGAFSLSRDGSLLALHLRENGRIDDNWRGEIWIMPSAGGPLRRVTDNAHDEDDISIAPDNSAILFRADVNAAGEPYYDANLFVVPIGGGPARLLQGEAAFEVEDAAWGRSSSEIFIRANMGVRSELFRVDVRHDRATQLTDGVHTITDWSYDPASDGHAIVLRSHASPADIHVLERRGKLVRRTSSGAASVVGFRLPRQELIRFTAKDGQMIEALLNYPLDYVPGRRYPLAIYSHGGPRSSDQYDLWYWRNYQPVLAARGWAYLTVNYRGGRGYGDAFMRDMVGQYFRNAHTDVLAGVDHVVAMGVADPDRLVTFGWSAGGHMVNKLITVTDRFKAASSGAGAVEWTSMTGESDVSYTRGLLFGGKPWLEGGPVDVYRADSPIYDMWRVRTPTLIFVGAEDERVPPSQSKMLYRALRDNGVETRLYIAPREPHAFRELRHRLFKIDTELDWFERYVNKRRHPRTPLP